MSQPVAPKTPGPPPGKKMMLALRFVSGKYQGGEFPMTPDKEIVVGRSSDLDMILIEDMVSRRHARFGYEGGALFIEDLGSTNGTFVNGEKIRRAWLQEGDRVLIGTSILKVVAAESDPATQEVAPMSLASVAAQRRDQAPRTMSGSIAEVPLPDLLQLFGTSRKTGVLVLRQDDDVGRIYLDKGSIAHVTLNDDPEIAPTKAIFRLLAWQSGTFDLESGDSDPPPSNLQMNVQEVLMESFRQLDELNAMIERLPSRSAGIAIPSPLTSRLRDLSPDELDVFQIALHAPRLGTVLDRSPKSDLETAQLLQQLLEKGFLVTA